MTLKLQRDQIVLVRRKLEVQFEAAENAAKSLLREDKKSLALLALKRRKHQSDLIHQAENHLLQVNTLISNVEVAAMQADLVKALESGNKALKTIQNELSFDYVSQLMEENSELQSQVTEIGEMLASAQSEDASVFEDYKRLEAQVALDRISEVPNAPSSSIRVTTDGDNLTNRQDILTSESGDSEREAVALAS